MGDELLVARDVPLGGTRAIMVRRALPHRRIRTIGAWCFADHYGPVSGTPMFVAPHPHMGLQTVTWLLAGEVEHKDSVGSKVTVKPGDLSLMTSGRGISHSEYSLDAATPMLTGIQFWVALPDSARQMEPTFEFIEGDPSDDPIKVFIGELAGRTSRATVYTPMVGAQITLAAVVAQRLELNPEFEHGVVAASGDIRVDGSLVRHGQMMYLEPGRKQVAIVASEPATAVLIGGEPFDETLVMWWNFVGRSHEDIVTAREEWESGTRFGTVVGDDNPRIPAPPMPNLRLKPRRNLS